ncbi:hypothetical protein L1F06_015470 [Ectopseudomonas hydrolytica]|uniref:Uncharacterized protein n=1 Tax=Ectopseudomonas hydrolytica TaxID=2493633 RepID=A0ABY5A2G2_9GAMM|nr:hypothetical protein [Pseudomonas hydrolytica]USR38069.1 hypothetical protein L1F06_015470 [Pseudomonas hydrolytica]
MALIKYFKVSTLPGSLEPDSFYYVENGTYAESYLTNGAGVARAIGNSAMVNALINAALAELEVEANAVDIVADIAARDALIATLERNAMILVVDASADPTVNAGSALYAYAHSTVQTYKIAEYESMDVVLEWSAIQNGPSSTPAQIDTAVSQSHTHANKATLDGFSESGGLLRYGGQPIPTEWDGVNW